MEFISDKIFKYAGDHTSPEPRVLKEINRETNVNNLFPRMLSGHFQGRLLSMISSMIRPATVLDIGTYTGYSVICLAEGLAEKGIIYSIEINFELEEIIWKNLKKAGIQDRVRLYFDDALKVIPGIDRKFDLVFIDADKMNYISYYEILMEKVNPGGFIIADNVLWSGKVIDMEDKDKEAKKLREFNDHVAADPRVENILIPLRDGIMIIRKLQ